VSRERFAGQNVVATGDMPHEFSEASATGNSPGTSWHVEGSGDFDGGGKADILWQGTNGQAVVWQMRGTNILTNAAIGPNPGTSWHMIAAIS